MNECKPHNPENVSVKHVAILFSVLLYFPHWQLTWDHCQWRIKEEACDRLTCNGEDDRSNDHDEGLKSVGVDYSSQATWRNRGLSGYCSILSWWFNVIWVNGVKSESALLDRAINTVTAMWRIKVIMQLCWNQSCRS